MFMFVHLRFRSCFETIDARSLGTYAYTSMLGR
jgi:hypothetical protein